jgi:Na+/H+-dicarboxylate symporter
MGPPTASLKGASTTAALLGLAAGLAMGSVFPQSPAPLVAGGAAFLGAVGTVWVRALQLTILPLVLCQLLLAVIAGRGSRPVGRMLGVAVALFLALLGLAALFTLALTIPLMDLFRFDPDTVEALRASIPQGARAPAGPTPSDLSLSDWLAGLVPTNLFRAAANGELLQLIVFTLFFALAVTHIDPQRRDQLARFFEALAEALFVMISWLLRLTPVGVLAVAFSSSREVGWGVATVLLEFAALLSGVLLAFTLLLYPIAAFLGRVRLRAFAQALYPGQLVAVGTRSSLAALPALTEGARSKLEVPPETLGFALPFSAAAFKVNWTISGPVGLIFLSHLYGIELRPTQVLAFVLTVMVMSFSSPGIAGGGDTFKTLVAYLAAGLPAEGVVMIKVVDVIPDVFKTLVNVTGYMTVTVLMARLFPRPALLSRGPETDVLPTRGKTAPFVE